MTHGKRLDEVVELLCALGEAKRIMEDVDEESYLCLFSSRQRGDYESFLDNPLSSVIQDIAYGQLDRDDVRYLFEAGLATAEKDDGDDLPRMGM